MQKAYYARGLDFLPRVVLIITIGLITAVTSYQATATDVFTEPVGFITLSAEGINAHGGSSAASFWGLGMAPLPVQKGIINSVSGKTLTDLNGNFANNQYSGAGVQYEIEITSSNNAAHQAARGRRQRRVEADEVAFRQQLFEGHELHTALFGVRVRRRVVTEQSHIKAASAPRDRLPNATAADQAQSPAADIPTPGRGPFALRHG